MYGTIKFNRAARDAGIKPFLVSRQYQARGASFRRNRAWTTRPTT
jgi:hypothetical protein